VAIVTPAPCPPSIQVLAPGYIVPLPQAPATVAPAQPGTPSAPLTAATSVAASEASENLAGAGGSSNDVANEGASSGAAQSEPPAATGDGQVEAGGVTVGGAGAERVSEAADPSPDDAGDTPSAPSMSASLPQAQQQQEQAEQLQKAAAEEAARAAKTQADAARLAAASAPAPAPLLDLAPRTDAGMGDAAGWRVLGVMMLAVASGKAAVVEVALDLIHKLIALRWGAVDMLGLVACR